MLTAFVVTAMDEIEWNSSTNDVNSWNTLNYLYPLNHAVEVFLGLCSQGHPVELPTIVLSLAFQSARIHEALTRAHCTETGERALCWQSLNPLLPVLHGLLLPGYGIQETGS